ncbi:serine/threonine receptor-like kinase NFP [Impatiens glandulifera]|uniref:serine/threonine receptor-like kinase NFP n=1 Tax=Impatiens glandulifera TaxID=253017 RepID=UPI001FB12EFB|nr:serine/threonine receptor-like kinase NFP [Impatiens glandulifera]
MKEVRKLKMEHTSIFSILTIIIVFSDLHFLNTEAQLPSNTTGYTCKPDPTTYPCQTYVFYRAISPNLLDLASIGDLFAVSRLSIAESSNISSPSTPLISDQSLFVPITCSCTTVNSSVSLSYANLSYKIQSGDTFYLVSTTLFQNLTTYQSVEAVNPNLIPEQLDIGDVVIFPIFCKCINITQLPKHSYLISYVFRPSDTIDSIASRFGTTPQSIVDINGGNQFQPSETIFVPVFRLPNITQPIYVPPPPPVSIHEDDGTVKGLAIGLGFSGLLLILVICLWSYREMVGRKRDGVKGEEGIIQVGKRVQYNDNKEMEVSLLSDVSDHLDKFRVFKIEELIKATDGFDDRKVIQGSVYQGSIDGMLFAIKRMKWNAYEELKILQKVNHGNLVKLEGFCVDPENANCYLVYEHIENGSLHSWLHGNKKKEKLNWKTKLKIAIDVANGLQYIHEHTQPKVVHKDIKTSNILLDSNMRAKIANFGLAKSGCNAITMHIVGTQGYIAPEYLSDGIVSTKMDVYSFGVVLLELISSREVIDEDGRVIGETVEEILKCGSKEMRETRVKEWIGDWESDYSIESVVNVMTVGLACLSKNPSRRPSMVDVVYALCKSDDNLLFDVSQESLLPRNIIAR